MQKTLVIYAHPNKKGFCGEIFFANRFELENQEVDFEVLDLYEINYDPVLKDSEHYTSGGYEISQKNKEIQEKIKKRKFDFYISCLVAKYAGNFERFC
jgi:putative NADPH-quinone reductase